MPQEATSRHLQNITELTVVARIKPGFVHALDTRTYAGRLHTLMKTLNSLRMSSREYEAIRPISDTVERIQSIHSFRLAVIENEQKLLLAVTFDRGWEAYIRIIWRDLGTLLDVMFCNCVDYPLAHEASFTQYMAWIRANQVEADFFYAATPMTVSDLQYLRQIESLHREGRDPAVSDRAAAVLVASEPEALAAKAARRCPMTAARQGLAALGGLYRLRELYADDADGRCLLRAAQEILRELAQMNTRRLFPDDSAERRRFAAALEWFETELPSRPALGAERLSYEATRVQGGILTAYPGVTHGALVMLHFADRAAAQRFLRGVKVTDEAAGASLQVGQLATNLAFSWAGLAKLGVAQNDLARLPKEFKEGMEERAGLLGDVRGNHPRNWRLPARNWPIDSSPENGVPLSTVDALVQLRIAPLVGDTHRDTSLDHRISGNPAHPLYAEVARYAALAGVTLLSVQPLLRRVAPEGGEVPGHFGFIDGRSQPTLAPDASRKHWDDTVPRGEMLLGYNRHADEPGPADWLQDDGSFLVLRKYRQDVAAWNEFLDAAVRELSAAHPGVPFSRDDLIGKIVGRRPDGSSLVQNAGGASPDQDKDPRNDNDFNYEGDAEGRQCPFQSHARRVNPRNSVPGKPVPRILRRGMPYGPTDPQAAPQDELGLVFMAYNASIADQFEVLQRWISGGNSSGVYSGQSDPLLGVPQEGEPRTFRFQHHGEVMRVDLDGDGVRPPVILEWGAYLFVPSLPAIAKLAEGLCPMHAPKPSSAPPHSAQVRHGEQIIHRLRGLLAAERPECEVTNAWKACLEDLSARMNGDTAAVWAAIRACHGGVLDTRTSYGVLVGSTELVAKVMSDERHYSVKGYANRMKSSIGSIFLGMDRGDAAYQRDAHAIEAIHQGIQQITEAEAFAQAHAVAKTFLTQLLDGSNGEASFDIKEYSDAVLYGLCVHWFDLPADGQLAAGGWTPQALPARCPGHFTSPSRYIFSPNPGESAEDYGRRHGEALKHAVTAFVCKLRQEGRTPRAGSLTERIFDAFSERRSEARMAGNEHPIDELRASTLIGVMMGFLPTVDGNLRSVLYEWIEQRSLWTLQSTLLHHGLPASFNDAKAVIGPALLHSMTRSPVPDLVWRTAVADDRLGPVRVHSGQRVVVGILSATHQNLEACPATQAHLPKNFEGDFPMFGGNRAAADAPTHACPGREMALGVLLGMLTALMEAGVLRTHPAPLTLILVKRPAR